MTERISWADIVDREDEGVDDDDIHLPWLLDGVSSNSSEPYVADRSWAQVVAGDAASLGTRGADASAVGPTDEAGDPVGIRAVQSILMSATQMNLSHFHTAGMSTSSTTAGVAPSAAEAMDSAYTKMNTCMRFRASASVQDIRRRLVGANLRSFVLTIGSSFTVLPDHESVWYKVLGVPMPDSVLRLYIDPRRMWYHGMTLDTLAQGAFGDDCSWRVSPDFMGMIDIEVPSTHMSSWLSRMESCVCGTPRILSCEVVSGTVATRGTDVLAASRVPGVDRATIVSNNVAEVERVYGIEAAAGVLSELVGSCVVSDFMARTGTVLSFNKRSSEVQAKGLLTSMGFERPKDDIREAVTPKTSAYKSRGPRVYEAIMTGVDPFPGFEVLTVDPRKRPLSDRKASVLLDRLPTAQWWPDRSSA